MAHTHLLQRVSWDEADLMASSTLHSGQEWTTLQCCMPVTIAKKAMTTTDASPCGIMPICGTAGSRLAALQCSATRLTTYGTALL